MTEKNVLIIGYGVVGSNLAKELAPLKPDIYDKFKPQVNTRRPIKYDFAFICVDTPLTPMLSLDIAAVEVALKENEADIYIIKSTVTPGTIKSLKDKTGKRIIFSPEYYGGTQHCNNYRFRFTILGGERGACLAVQQLLQRIYDGRHTFRITTSLTAELVKFMENSFLAAKVSFCVQFWEIAKQFGIDYAELRELFVLDPRINSSHTYVYDDAPYWASHCLDKDVPAIAQLAEAPLLKEIIKYNQTCRKKYKS